MSLLVFIIILTCDKFFVLTMYICTLLFRYFISSYYSTRCWNISLAPGLVAIHLLTEFPKKFHMKLLASDIIFIQLSTKTLLLWRCRVSF